MDQSDLTLLFARAFKRAGYVRSNFQEGEVNSSGIFSRTVKSSDPRAVLLVSFELVKIIPHLFKLVLKPENAPVIDPH